MVSRKDRKGQPSLRPLLLCDLCVELKWSCLCCAKSHHQKRLRSAKLSTCVTHVDSQRTPEDDDFIFFAYVIGLAVLM